MMSAGIYTAGFLPAEFATSSFHALWNELDWERREDAPRREYWTNVFGRSYTYGRGLGVRTYESKPSHPVIDHLNGLLSARLGFMYEGCFLNGYDADRSRQDWLGWHEDDDPGIDHSKPIAIVTLYRVVNPKTRKIAFREKLSLNPETNKRDFGPTEEVYLENGSLMLMPAGFQDTHQHAIPKMGTDWDSRISLTFRALI